EKFESIIQTWQEEELSPSCAWIIKYASRTKDKTKK
ncbi:DNA alkylation repair protein, partial [Streptococcus gordonii]|nr:DNA alkylation repair protein [Streptococcus gordonii]